MTRQLASSRTVRWLGGLAVLFSVATAAVVLRGQEEDVNPIGILFRRREARNAQRQQDDKPPPSGQLPSDVPKAPPAQYTQSRPAPAAENTDPLMKYVDEALRLSQRRLLLAEAPNGKTNSPWQIMHGILALRHNLELRTPRGTVNAIAWVSRDPVFRGEHWFEATRFGGRAHPFSVPYHFEGHVNQFLALLTMSNLPLDHKIGVAGGKGYVTMADMVRHAQMMVNANEEISWTLWFLTHYLEPDAVWTNYNGERWGMEKLVSMQTGQTVTTAPCGGTHGLFALAYARNSYLQKHGKVSGTWLQADQKIQKYIAEARATQNRDGSFSAHFFREPGHTEDPTDRLKTSGHMLEWLMMAVPQQELKQNWVRYGVYRVAADLIQFSNQEIDPGALYHAVHSITLYRERVTPRQITPQNPKPLESQLANQPRPSAAASAPAPAKTAPPPPTIDPKAVASTPKSPPPPRPVVEPAPEKRVAMAPQDDSPTPPKVATESPATRPDAELVVEAPKQIPTNRSASPVPPSTSPAPDEAKTAATTPGQDSPIVLPMLPTPGPKPVPDGKRAVSILPIDEPVGTTSTPPSPTPIDPPTDDPPPESAAGNLPVPPLPTLDLLDRATRNSKPAESASEPPKPTTVTSPSPIVLPPLPLDPVDQTDVENDN